MASPLRQPTSLPLDPVLLDEARALGVNVSRAVETGLQEAIHAAEEWKRENAEAIASSNAWVKANGLPLAKYRQF